MTGPDGGGQNGGDAESVVQVVIRRSDPIRLARYQVSRFQPMKALDLLLSIQRDCDPTLAFRFSCRVAMCGTCTVRMNGRAVLACQSPVPAGSAPVYLEPLAGLPVLRDLVVDTRPFFRQWASVLPYFVPAAADCEPAQIPRDSAERRLIDPRLDCVTCGACYSSCDIAGHDRDYLGPAALNRALVLVADTRDGATAERLERVRAADGIGRCHSIYSCTADCPKALDPAGAIRRLRRWKLRSRLRGLP